MYVCMYVCMCVCMVYGSNEKDTSETADTVGCCSLRAEHLKFIAPNRVLFDFLGKDSMRYLNEVQVCVYVCGCV